jgi:D-3-phosphoglycerate dehydrogenase / 2-oxoglutarate reductase
VSDPPLVLLSARIGPLTRWETGIADQVPCRVELRPLGTREEIAAHAPGARVIILGAVEPFDAVTLAGLHNLGLIARRGAGVDNVDVGAAAAHGITVTNVPDATVEEVSDHALALVFSLLRGVPGAHVAALAGDLLAARAAVDRSRPTGECVLAVLGAGRIGRRLVAKAAPLFRQVLVVDPFVEDVPGARVVPLAEALADADAVSVHTPLTSQTEGLLNATTLGAARPGLVVVNAARAEVIDEDALEEAVRTGLVAGVGLDVTVGAERWRRLIADGHPNVLLTAHTGGRGSLAQQTLRRRCAEQVVAYLSGQDPGCVVTPGPRDQ